MTPSDENDLPLMMAPSLSSSYPSFLFTGIHPSLQDLNHELDQLGGGSARIGTLEYDCVIDDRIHKDSYQILWPLGKSVGLRNARLPKNSPVAEAMKYFPVTSVGRYSSSEYSQTSVHHSQCGYPPCPTITITVLRNITQWLLDGFNASVICHGSNPTKTESLYGSDFSNRKEPNFRKGFVYEILRELYQQIQDNSESVTTVLSISLWALKGNHVIE